MAGPMVSGSVFQEELWMSLQLLRMGREWVVGGVRSERERRGSSRCGDFILCYSCDWTVCVTSGVVL